MRIVRNTEFIRKRKRLARIAALVGFLLLASNRWRELAPRENGSAQQEHRGRAVGGTLTGSLQQGVAP